ncbi:HD domain-containing protein [Flavihumibacter sp. UBA7668]|uniref:HD domain-containing protein n=1 Tax=Flavihumibacter sp. UBA7668 TaxID=1946542 RepID=UPI0025B81D27|nr:HD domain-containing protein [Flavihumibacter sp. UBA7668]
MDTNQLIRNTVEFVQKTLAAAEGGHDWWHIYRVWQTSKTIANAELAAKDGMTPNLLIIELAALLHDIADSKFHDGDDSIGPRVAGEYLQAQQVNPEIIREVQQIITHISFKGGHNVGTYYSVELAIVQDADRLDAIGAIGIARAFNYGGYKNRPLYDPNQPPNLQKTVEQYKFNNDPTINHFYEKLFLLKDRMNTAAGKRLAAQRHAFMESYIEQFYQEWEGHR